MKIIANHAHLMPDQSWRPGDANLLLRYLDFCGIEKAVVFPPFGCQFQDDRWAANRWALEQVRQHADRFLPAGTLFPLAPDAVELLRMLQSEGVRLIKIHPSIEPHDIADPRAGPFYVEAERLGMILNYHTGAHRSRLSWSRPEKFDDLAFDYPKLRLVLEHLGGRAYAELTLAVMGNHRGDKPRVLGGLTSIFDKVHQPLWYMDRQHLQEAIEIVGADAFIFGLDFPWNTMEATRQAIETIRGFSIPETDKEKLLGGNLLGLLSSGGT